MREVKHIAIIMDGNGRWALNNKKSRNYGHKKGIGNILSIVNFCKKKKISYLTLYVFSLDNWKRSPKEISYLFSLLEKFLDKKSVDLVKNKIKIKFMGEKTGLIKNFISKMKKIENLTSKNFDITVNLAFNYSSKAEIKNAVTKIILNKKIKKISTDLIEANLYTANIPDPEILIRTGDTNRLSDFLLWQISYTEIFFLKKMWPDFEEKDLKKIISKYFSIKRNFGSIDE